MAVDHLSVYLKRSLKAAMLIAAGISLVAVNQRAGAAPKADEGAEKKVDFKKDVQPILKESCIRCHKAPEARGAGGGPGGGAGRGPGGSPGGPAGGLRLDEHGEALQRGKHGV